MKPKRQKLSPEEEALRTPPVHILIDAKNDRIHKKSKEDQMNKVVIKKKRKVYKIEDLTEADINMLAQAYSIPQDHFMCFGKYYYKLRALELVDDELQITHQGKMLIWHLQSERKSQ